MKISKILYFAGGIAFFIILFLVFLFYKYTRPPVQIEDTLSTELIADHVVSYIVTKDGNYVYYVTAKQYEEEKVTEYYSQYSTKLELIEYDINRKETTNIDEYITSMGPNLVYAAEVVEYDGGFIWMVEYDKYCRYQDFNGNVSGGYNYDDYIESEYSECEHKFGSVYGNRGLGIDEYIRDNNSEVKYSGSLLNGMKISSENIEISTASTCSKLLAGINKCGTSATINWNNEYYTAVGRDFFASNNSNYMGVDKNLYLLFGYKLFMIDNPN